MLYNKKVLRLFLLACIVSSTSFAKEKSPVSVETDFRYVPSKPLFLYEVYSFKSSLPAKSQARVYLAFVNDILQFVKESGALFTARYELSIELFDVYGIHRASQILTTAATATSFEETNSRTIVTHHRFDFDVPPGFYDMVLEMTDLDTNRKLKRKKSFEVVGFEEDRLSMSDVIFVDSSASGTLESTDWSPNLNRTLEDGNSDFGVHFEIYNPVLDSISFSVQVRNSRDSLVFEEQLIKDQEVIAHFVSLKERLLAAGPYYLKVEAQAAGHVVTTRESFLSQYSPVNGAAEDAGESQYHLEAMAYISDSDEYKLIMQASGSERVELIRQFWQQRDPTQDTPANELKEEFHRRVQFCARYFSVPLKDKRGWSTDRGKTYIVFGRPDELRRRSVDIDSNPYEIWYYSGIDRRFVFLDKSGFGDYKLVHKD